MGYKNLNILKNNKNIYKELEDKAIKLEKGFNKNIKELGIKATVVRFKSMLCLFFGEGPFENYDDVSKCDTKKYAVYFKEMLNRGILVAPSQFEAIFLSDAHNDEDIQKTIKANYEALYKVR